MLYSNTNTKIETYYSLEEAEKEVGQIKLPNMPKEYRLNKIQYSNDGFTTPILIVYYQTKTQKELIFLSTSNIAGDMDYEIVSSNFISDIKWIVAYDGFDLFRDRFVLKWKDSNQLGFKYLVTENIEDKHLLIKIAEKYND